MTADAVLLELLARVAANNGNQTFISAHDLNECPADAVSAMQKQGLIEKAPPAKNITCQGCEQSCLMPVTIVTNKSGSINTFISCDKRDDISRVTVPLNYIEQWQISCHSIAKLIAIILNINHTKTSIQRPNQWEIGILKGTQHSSHITLNIDHELILSLAGHSILLNEVLSIDGAKFKIDKKRLLKLVNNPLKGGGNDESAKEHRARIIKRRIELINNGCKNFIQVIAKEENITSRRVHQIINKSSPKND